MKLKSYSKKQPVLMKTLHLWNVSALNWCKCQR